MDQHRAVSHTIKAVIFDFDGTLFDLNVDWLQLQNASLKKIAASELEGVRRGQPLPHSLNTLQRLAVNYELAIVSRNFHETVKAGLTKIGFTQPIPILGREDVHNPKPHPEALRKVLDTLGLPIDQVIVVGDTSHDVQIARSLKVPVIIIKNTSLEFIPKDADYYITSLIELHDILKELHGD